MKVFKRESKSIEELGPPPKPPVYEQEQTETVDAEITDQQPVEKEIDPNWIGVVSPENFVSDASFKADQINLLFSILHELRELNKEIKDLK